MAERDDSQEINLRQYVAVIRQKLWIVLLALVAAIVPTAIFLVREKPVYEANSTVLIEQGGATAIDEKGPVLPGIDPEIEEALLLSGTVMRSVLKGIDPYFDGLSEADKLARIAAFKSRIKMSFNKSQSYGSSQSALVSITAEAFDPAEAAQVANAVTQTYIDKTHERELAESSTWMDWFGEQLKDMRQKVTDAEEKFQAFKLDKGIIGLSERKAELATKMTTASNSHLQARLERMDAELSLSALEKAFAQGPVAATPAFASYGSAAVVALKSQLDGVQAELNEKLSIFKPKHPVIADLKEKARLLEAQLESQEKEIIKTQRNKINGLKASETSLANTLDAYKEEVQKLNTLELQYSILEREVDSSRDLYNLLMERRKRSAIESGISRRRISIVEPAIAISAPVPKKLALKLLVASIIGSMIGVGLAFLIDYLEMTYKTPEDIERHLGLWVVGVIPRFEPKTEPVLSFSGIAVDQARKRSRRDKG
ncbi:MAG: GumC family protein [Candidatus Coatesbacteria bacterium]|nr:GumC family protein [Candidatus Coatesbacteria bacterium]